MFDHDPFLESISQKPKFDLIVGAPIPQIALLNRYECIFA